ncbi:MAG: pyridoxal phosphate-dependent aminotransferase [Tepidisphaerales bacterium]
MTVATPNDRTSSDTLAGEEAIYLASRVRRIDASGIRKVFDLAAKLKDPINLSIGLPDFDVPEPAKQAAIDAIRRGFNRYTPTQGIPELREKLFHQLTAELGRRPGELLVTSGVSGGLLLAIMACIDPGDECVFLDPAFVAYRHMVTMAGGVPVAVPSYPDFRFDPERVAAAITPRTRLLILNTPANPTGVVMTEQDVHAAAELARRHDLTVVADEIYDPFYYGPRPTSLAKLWEKTVLLRGFSKSHAMTGWRLGYAAGPEPVISAMAKLQQYTFVCAPSPLQVAATVAADLDMTAYVQQYRAKRDLVYGLLSRKFEVVRPEGAFYIFPKVTPRWKTATELATAAIERQVLVIPGGVFSSQDTHFRISYAAPDDKLKAGCEVLCELA